MTYKAKAAVCSEIRKKHSTQSEHHVEFWLLNLVVPKDILKFWKVTLSVLYRLFCCLLQ